MWLNNADKLNTGLAIVFCATLTFYLTREKHDGPMKIYLSICPSVCLLGECNLIFCCTGPTDPNFR